MSLGIDVFRLTAAWTQSFSDLVEGKVGGSWAQVGDRASFASLFENAQTALKSKRWEGVRSSTFQLPWKDPYAKVFWTHYLGKPVGDVTGDEAWIHAVPLRAKVPLTVDAPDFPGPVYHEAFVYPHGVAFALTATARRTGETVPLARVHELGFALLKSRSLTVKRENELPLEMTATSLGEMALQMLCTDIVGGPPAAGTRSPEPMTILTVLDAEGVDPHERPVKDNDLHRFLNAVTEWTSSIETPTLRDLDAALIPLRHRAAPGNVLYATKRGRAVWFPENFGKSPSSSLTCYHRNLLSGAVQAEALGLHVAAAAEWIDKLGTGMAEPHRQSVRRAALLLGNLHEGRGRLEAEAGNIFRSGSTKRLIEDAYLDVLNRIRKLFGFPTIVATPNGKKKQPEGS